MFDPNSNPINCMSELTTFRSYKRPAHYLDVESSNKA